MPNSFDTPEWLTADVMDHFKSETIRVRMPQRFTLPAATVASPVIPPMTTGALVALTAAAVIFSPRKISRRNLLGLGWSR